MQATAEPMSKKTENADEDYFVRLPPEYRALAKKLREVTGRAATVCIQIAIEQAAVDHGIPFKPNWPKLLKRPG